MAIASPRGEAGSARPSHALSAAELLAWRRAMLAIEGAGDGSAAGLDWLLDLAGGIRWPALQALWLHPQRHVQLQASLQELETLWRRHCLRSEPLQYLVGRCPWRDLELSVAPGVLIPRQETEQLLELALQLAPSAPAEGPLCWADLGTGSGCLAVGLARALPHGCGLVVDASPEALLQAAANLQALLPPGSLIEGPVVVDPQKPAERGQSPSPQSGVSDRLVRRVLLRQGSWWEPIASWWGRLQLVVSNPPYIPTAVLAGLDPVVRDHEPALALDGGADGLTAIRRIVAGAGAGLAPGGLLLLEHHHDQSEAVLALLAAAGLQDCRAHRDVEGVLRFASARRPNQSDAAADASAGGIAP